MNMKKMSKRVLTVVLCGMLVQFTAQANYYSPTGQSNVQTQAPASAPQLSPQQIQQLVAPIALYPDALVAQILAPSTYPAQIVDADRCMQIHSNFKEEELDKDVATQPCTPN